jgi:hypothetical protein
VDLRDPNKAYLELADQPANNTPNTPKEEIAKKKIIPKERSDMVKAVPKGITAQPKILKVKDKIGAKIKRLLLEISGKTVSLITNFNPSATLMETRRLLKLASSTAGSIGRLPLPLTRVAEQRSYPPATLGGGSPHPPHQHSVGGVWNAPAAPPHHLWWWWAGAGGVF